MLQCRYLRWSPETTHAISAEYLQFGKYDQKDKFVIKILNICSGIFFFQKRTWLMNRVYTERKELKKIANIEFFSDGKKFV